MKELIYTHHLSIYTPDYSLRRVFVDKLAAFGYTVNKANMSDMAYIWINETDPSTQSYYRASEEDTYSWGNGKVRFANHHDTDDRENEPIMRFELPGDWYEALYYATEMKRSEKILRFFQNEKDKTV